MKNSTPRIRIARPDTGALLAALIGAAAFVAGISARGQTAGSEPEPPARADFASAFERFHALGLPDARDAKPVTLSYSSRDDPPVWLTEEKDGEAIILVDQVTPTVCGKSGDGPGGEEPDHHSGVTWKPAKVEDFLRRATASLERHKAGMRNGDFYFNENEAEYGTYLLFAAHLHRRGMRDEANALATLLFESSKNPEAPVALALEEIAGARYARLADGFFADGNWTRFADGIDALATAFGTRWPHSPGGRLLAEKLRARATAIAPPAIDAPGLDAVDQSLLAALGALEPGTRLPSNFSRDGEGNPTLWILDPPEPGADDPSVFTRILARGLDSLPLLVALLGDEFLLPVRSADAEMNYEAEEMYFSDDDSGVQPLVSAEAAYSRLTRPLTRGEIAAQLLTPVLGPEARETNDPAQLRTLLTNWLAAHGKKSPLELARHYLKSGGEAQVGAALGILIDQGEESDIAGIEKHLLAYDPETGHLFEKYQAVSGYLRKRGAAGKEFLANYEEQCRKAYHEQQGGGFLQKMSNNSELKRYFAPLHELVNPRALGEVLDQALADRTPMGEIAPVIGAKLGEMDSAEEKDAALEALLQAVVANPDRPEVALGVLGMLGDGFRGSAMEKPPLVLAHAPRWQSILRIDASTPGPFGRQALTTAEYAAYVMESLYGDIDDFRNLARLYPIDWRRANALALERALARIGGQDGQDLPALPALGDGGPGDPAEAWSRFAGTEPSARPAMLASLEFTELAALHHHLSRKRTDGDEPAETEHGEETPTPDSALLAEIARQANRIEAVDLPPDLAEPLAILRDAKGKALDRPLLEAVVEALKSLATGGGGDIVAVTVRRGDALAGTTLAVARHQPAKMEQSERNFLIQSQGSLGEDSRHAMVAAYFGSHSARNRGIWNCPSPVDPDAPETPDDALAVDGTPARASSGEADNADFWKTCDALLDGSDNPLAYAAISFWCVPADTLAADPAPSDAQP